MILLPAKPADAHLLKLRNEDLNEVSEGWRERVRAAIEAGGVFAGWDLEGNLVGLGGVQVTPTSMTPWLLCSRHVAQHKASVWRLARRAVNCMRRAPQGASNHVPSDSPNRAFVERLGFHLVPDPERPGWDRFFLPSHV